MPVVCNDKCPWLSVQKTANPAVAALFLGGRCPCCAGRDGAAGAFCGCERPCDHTATSSCLFNSRGASDSVHRQSRGHLVVQQRLVRSFYQWRYGGGERAFLTHLASFFALLRFGVERHFLEPSMVKSSLPSRAPFANWTVVMWIYTHS